MQTPEKLNQEFGFFDRNRLAPSNEVGDPGRYNSIINLEILPNRILPLVGYARSGGISSAESIAPFDSRIGHQITAEDFDIEKRRNTLAGVRERGEHSVISPDNPNYISVQPNYSAFEASGLISITKGPMGLDVKFDEEVREVMERLRLQLEFPGNGSDLTSPDYTPTTSYEGRFIEWTLDSGDLLMQFFYPLDAGSLPSDSLYSRGERVWNGFGLFVPDDLDRLGLIKAKFVIEGESEPSGFTGDVPDKFTWKG